MTPRELAARRLEVETLKFEAMDLDRRHPNLFGSVLWGPVDHVELSRWGIRFPGKQGRNCPFVTAHTTQGLGRWILIAGQKEAQDDLARFADKLGDARLDLGGCGIFQSAGGALAAAALIDRLVQVARLDRIDISIGYEQAPYHVELSAVNDKWNARRFKSDAERKELASRLEELAQRPVDPRGPWSFTLKQSIPHGVVRLLNAHLVDLEDSPQGAASPTNLEPSAFRHSHRQGLSMTPREREIRLPRIERLRDEAFNLNRAYPTLRGAVMVGRFTGGNGFPPGVESLFQADPMSPRQHLRPGHCRPTCVSGLSSTEARSTLILASLTRRDLGVAYAGDGMIEYKELAKKIGDLDLDVPGIGRFGFSDEESRFDAHERLIIFLAAFARQCPEGSVIRADLTPFADAGWQPIPTSRTAILDPKAEAGGSAFTLTIRQGLFDALGELLAIAGAELEHATEPYTSDSRQPQPDLGTGEALSARLPLKAKEPPAIAFRCYYLCVIVGETQKNAAKQLLGDTGKQGQVSRHKNKVVEWLAAGNSLPILDSAKPATITPRDPSKLDAIPRTDRKRNLAGPRRE